ncbi:hypothetical protein MHU86_8359 [Fragilaria crotonensis]|nr:hypothetical protein MHU86_8359 [Fragilaria crotonensis]
MARTIHSSTYNSKAVCQYYYSTSDDGTTWHCRKCSQPKSKNGGWTNLLSHLKSCVGKDYMDQYMSHAARSQARLDTSSGDPTISGGSFLLDSFVLRLSDAEKEMAEWINFVVVKSMPISIVECPHLRRLAKLKPVSIKSVRKHILSLKAIVQEEIKVRLPSKFAIIFDGWTEGTDHYIGIWASYNSVDNKNDGKEVPVQTLLSIRPLLADGIEGMTAADHLLHISRVLCHLCHKLNLAVKRWIKEQPQLTDIIEKVAAVMKKASTLKVAAKLKQSTKYATVRENDTRWSSTYNMVRRYFQIQPQLNALVELLQLLPTPVEVDALSRGFKSLKNFDAITVLLQRDGIPFVEVRNIFKVLIEDFPEMEHHLGERSSLVVDPDFELGIMRISRGMPLTREQQNAVRNLVKPDIPDVVDIDSDDINDAEEDVDESYASQVVKRLKLQMRETVQREQYCNLDVIPATSVNCERLFSLAKHILTDTRKNTSPLLFEALLFLKVNRKLWDAYSVGKAMGRTRGIDDAHPNGNTLHHEDDSSRGGADDEYGMHVDTDVGGDY